MKLGLRRLLWVCKGPTPDPSTYGKNRYKDRYNSAKQSNSHSTVDAEEDAEERAREMVPSTASSIEDASSIKDAAIAAGVAGAGATAAGLSLASAKKVEAIEEKAVEKIQKTDDKAMKDIAAVYRKRGVEMEERETPERSSSSRALALGAVAGSVAVVGAGGAALAAGLSSDDVEKIKTIEERAVDDIDNIADKANEDITKVYKKEGVALERPTKSRMTAAAAAAGLSVVAQRQVGAIDDRSVKRIEAIDAQAVDDIDSIYRENGMTMEKPSPKQTKVGNLTSTLAVTGATAAAAGAAMGSLDIARVQEIENNATEQIKSIDRQAGDDIAEVYESEGKWYDKPGASKAAAAAASAGLGLAAVKEIAGVEEEAEREIEAIDREAADEVIEADKIHAAQMHKYDKQGIAVDFIEKDEKAAFNKYAVIESKAAARITKSDESAAEKITEIYSKEGEMLEKSSGPFTTRGAAGTATTASAIAAAARGAENRKQMFANNRKERSVLIEEEEKSPSALESIGNGAHLAVYDVGAGVAWAGKSITGGLVDFEGPAEYDARSHYTPEERAQASCCACY